MNLKNIFYSPTDSRLRAGWRIAVQLILMGICIVMFAIPLSLVIIILPDINIDQLIKADLSLSGLAIILSVYLARKRLDKRTFSSLGLKWDRQAFKDILVGFLIAGLLMSLIFLVQIQAGWLSYQGFAINIPTLFLELITWLLVFVAVGFYEEILTRGYHLQNLEEGTTTTLAVLVSSTFFGILHLNNPNAGWSAFIGVSLAGFFLAFAYLRTRHLWLPIGLHIGWNFFEGPIFGFPLSGMTTPSLITHQVDGPVLLTGGAFGPEAGAVVVPALLIGALLVFLYTKKRELPK
jgi:membrane protease YdiL (CAAX protease family)